MGIRTLLVSAVVASSMLAATAAGAEVLDFSFAGRVITRGSARVGPS
jgi:hypothetical protein